MTNIMVIAYHNSAQHYSNRLTSFGPNLW